jgi:GntR family transcriptional repressor for pyruvate dehydrogenase complex
MLRAVANTTLADQVFGQLATEIASGRYPPGSAIPSERTLSEVFEVNRHVVREALKRLEQIGLLAIAQGGATTVRDLRRTAGLDLLAVLAEHAEADAGVLPLLAAALEMRAGIGVDVCRLCAQRAARDVADDLLEISERIAAVAKGPELLALDERFWQRILDGAGNLAYQLAFNSLIRGVHAMPELSVPWLEHELARSDFRRPIATAIAAGDADAATSTARTALTPDGELSAAPMDVPATRKRSAR